MNVEYYASTLMPDGTPNVQCYECVVANEDELRGVFDHVLSDLENDPFARMRFDYQTYLRALHEGRNPQ